MGELQTKGLWSQLRERKVTRVALAYVIVGWIMMQIGEVSFEALALPPWTLTLLIVLVLLGFPLAIVLAWAYELTPQGIRKDPAGNIEAVTDVDSFQDGAPSIAVLPFDDMSPKGNRPIFAREWLKKFLMHCVRSPICGWLRVLLHFSLAARVQISTKLAENSKYRRCLKAVCASPAIICV